MRAWKTVLILIVCVLIITSCGSSETLIETAAADLNMTAADLGDGYALNDEQGYEEVVATMEPEDAEDARDANMRTFMHPDGFVVVTIVISFKTVASAKANMRGLSQDFLEEMGEANLEELSAPAIGEDTFLAGGTADAEGLAFDVYLAAFRKSNVAGMVIVMGIQGFSTVTEDMAVEMTQKMAEKVK